MTCLFALGVLLLASRVFGDSVNSHLEKLSSKDPFVRVDAVHALRDLGKDAESAIPELIKLFPDHRIGIRGANLLPVPRENVSVSGEASRAIWVIGEASIPHLISCLENSEHDSQEVAAKTLGLFEKKAADATFALLKQCGHEAADVRRACLAALVSVGQQRGEVLEKVLSMQNREPDAEVRYVLVEAMQTFGGNDIRTVRALSSYLSDESAEVRGVAARALAKHEKHAEAAVSALVTRLADDGMRWEYLAPDMAHQIPVKDDVVASLVTLLEVAPGQTKRVAKAMSDENKPDERANAALVLVKSRIMQAQAKDVVRDILLNNNGGIEASLLVVSELGSTAQSMADLLKGFSRNANDQIRRQAIETLGNVGGSQAIDTLSKLMEHDDVIVRSWAAEALGEIGPDASSATPLLETAVVDKADPRSFLLRRHAAIALGRMGFVVSASVPTLLQVTKDSSEDADIRAAAARALGEISPRDKSVLQLLRGIVTDKESDDELRTAAASSLGKAQVDAKAAVPLFLSVLAEPYAHDELRAAAARSIGQVAVKSDSSVTALVSILREDPDWMNDDSRRESAWALGQLQAIQALELLKKVSMSKDEDESVRRAASDAVSRIEAGSR